jgi:hypothetical protein
VDDLAEDDLERMILGMMILTEMISWIVGEMISRR